MNIKTKAKYIITFIAIFIAICLLKIGTVEAVEMTETEMQEIIDSIIPDTMNLDIPEIEYKKANELVTVNIKKILEEKTIQYEEIVEHNIIKFDNNNLKITLTVGTISPIYRELEDFYKLKIDISIYDGNSYYSIEPKIIQLIYNNHNNYNLEDQTYIKNLDTSIPQYFEVPLNNNGEDWYRLIYEYLANKIVDDSVYFELGTDGGGGYITMECIPYIAIFKNGVLYDSKYLIPESDNKNVVFIPVIEVPSTIKKDEVNNYVIELMKEYSATVTSIEKGFTCNTYWKQYSSEMFRNISELYTLKFLDGSEEITIIRKEPNAQEILDLIPDTMELDIPEVDYKKADDIILTQIKNILKNENIKTEDIDNGVKIKDFPKQGYNTELTAWASPLYSIHLGFEFYKCQISLNVNDGKNFSERYSKTIDLIYNNHDSYNEADEKYVKNLKIKSPKYYEVDIDYLAIADTEWEEKHNDFYNIIGKYYTKLIGDDSVVVKADSGVGGSDGTLNLWTWESGTSIGIFKNGVLYDTRVMGQECTVPVITVPKHIKKDEMNKYVIDLITKSYKELGEKITKIEKGTKELGVNIPDGYTVYSDYGEGNSYIIIRKEKDVTKKDEKTNIKFETTTIAVPEDTKLVVEEIKEEKTKEVIKESLKEVSNKYVVFDISLISQEEKIQPNGKVKISIPIPDGFDTSNLAVYRIEKDGTKIEFKVEIVEIDHARYAQFETDHFSNYVLAEKTLEEKAPIQEIPKQEETKKPILDDEPKTGIIDMKLIIGIILVVSIMVVVKKNHETRKGE